MTKSYRIRSLAELLVDGMSFEEMFRQFDEVYEAQTELTALRNDLGDNEKWNRLMRHSPSSVFALLHYGRVVGFWSLFPMKAELYNDGLSGKNVNTSVDIHDLDEFTLPGEYSLYLVDLYVYREHRWSANTLIFRSFTSFLKQSARKGYFAARIFAHTASYHSINLCERLGFELKSDHRQHRMLNERGEIIPTKIYEIRLDSGQQNALFDLDAELRAIYGKHFSKGSSDLLAGESIARKLIADGESQRLELKQSLRFDSDSGLKNNSLENVVIKTIAGFANQEGGTLLIGVRDDGSIAGIEPDYSTFSGGNRDKFELHLTNLTNARFGAAFTAKNLRLSFLTMQGKVVCRVDVGRSITPVIVALPDRSGALIEKFFVRIGASTQELSPSQMAAFLSSRTGDTTAQRIG